MREKENFYINLIAIFSKITSMKYDVIVIGGGHAGCEAARRC